MGEALDSRRDEAAVIDEFGPPSVLELRDVPVPRPGPREVLVAVHAAGVGMWDAKLRDGTWAEDDVHFPKIIGIDGAGVIAEVGERVRRLHVGDRVWAYEFDTPKGGFYAGYVVVNMDHVGSMPSRLTMQQGGAGAATGLTALQGCVDHLELRRGETVMIFGASGAVGPLAVQFAARYRRTRVIAIVGSGRPSSSREARRRDRDRWTPARHGRPHQGGGARRARRGSRAGRQSGAQRIDRPGEDARTRGVPERGGAGTATTQARARDRVRRRREPNGVRRARTRGGRRGGHRADREGVPTHAGRGGSCACRTRPRRRTSRSEDSIAGRFGARPGRSNHRASTYGVRQHQDEVWRGAAPAKTRDGCRTGRRRRTAHNPEARCRAPAINPRRDAASSVSRSSTSSAGCALRAGRKSASTPRWT